MTPLKALSWTVLTVNQGFLAEARLLGDRATLVDTTRTHEEVAETIRAVAEGLL